MMNKYIYIEGKNFLAVHLSYSLTDLAPSEGLIKAIDHPQGTRVYPAVAGPRRPSVERPAPEVAFVAHCGQIEPQDDWPGPCMEPSHGHGLSGASESFREPTTGAGGRRGMEATGFI